MTVIKYLDRYKVDMNSFAKEISVVKQCSSTVASKQSGPQVIALGNHIAYIYKTLKGKSIVWTVVNVYLL